MKNSIKVFLAVTIVMFVIGAGCVVSYIKDQVKVTANASNTEAEIKTEVKTEAETEAELIAETDTESKNDKTEATTESKKTETATTESKPKTDSTTEAKKPATTETHTETTKPATTETRRTETTETSTQAPKHEHSWKWVIDQAAYDEDIYEDKPVYEDRPVYEERDNGHWQGFLYGEPTSYKSSVDYANATTDPNDLDAWDKAAAYFCNGYEYRWVEDIQKVQVGTEKVQTGTERVKTGTKHHDEVGHYECSCGATK